MNKISVLILGGGLQGISVANSLYRDGFTIFCYTKEFAYKHCRWIQESVFFELSIDVLCTYIAKRNISVIIPMSDKLSIWLSRNKETIQSYTRAKCAVPDYKAVMLASSKSDLMQLCIENDIPVPRTAKISSDNIEFIGNQIGFPALIKPDHSVGARGITKVGNIFELRSCHKAIIEKYGSCSLQEYIDNPDFYFNVMLYRYHNGEFSQGVILKITRFYPITGGSSCFCETVEDSVLLSICKKILDVLGWTGFADFDVLYDKKGKQYRIIEMNPRVPASLKAADISNVDFPLIIVNDELGLPHPETNYKSGLFLRYLGLDFMWFVKSKKRFNSTPSWFKFFGNQIFYQDIYGEDIKLSVCMAIENVLKLFRH